jgi:hypothetical protein
MGPKRIIMSAVIPMVMLTAACSSSRSEPQEAHTPASTAAGPAAAQQFVSERYGFRVALPTHWSGHDAQVD